MRDFFAPIDYEQFAKRLRALRDSRGFEDTKIAEKLGVSAQAVGKWMNARNLPDTQHICDLSDLFGVSTDYILKGVPGGEGGDGKEVAKCDVEEAAHESVELTMEQNRLGESNRMVEHLLRYAELSAA